MKNWKNLKLKIKKGDTLKVLSGKDKGKTGKVEKVYPKKNKVLVVGVNIYKKHRKSQGEGKPGGIIDIPRPLSCSKVALLCPKCKQPTRVGYKVSPTGKKRICKKCQQEI